MQSGECDECKSLGGKYRELEEKYEKLQEQFLRLQGGDLDALRISNKELYQQNLELEGKIERIQDENEALHSKCARFVDPTTTKVVHLIQNPADRSELERLRNENSRLHSLSESEKSKEKKGSSQEILSIEMEKLTRELKERDIRLERLKQVFQKKISEFREAIYRIFGFRVDVQDKIYKLISKYAENEGDVIVFELGRTQNGNYAVRLIETDYCRRLSEEIQVYLKVKSFPAYVSSITLDLFNNQTFKLPTT